MQFRLLIILFAIIFAVNDVIAENVSDALAARTSLLETQVNSLKDQFDIASTHKWLRKKIDDKDGSFVVTYPTFTSCTDRFSWMKFDLSTMHKDMGLLELRREEENYAKKYGLVIPNHPMVILSGSLEGVTFFETNDDYTNTSKGDVDIYNAELDVLTELSPWVSAGMIFKYDPGYGAYINRVSNSQVRMDCGWITIGQLNKSPFYFSLGQLYVPFGKYYDHLFTMPSTEALGKTRDRTVILGYDNHDNSVYAQLYGFLGETSVKTGSEILRHSGFNLGYNYRGDVLKIRANGGIIGNLAESIFMQYIFGSSTAAEQLNSQVLGLDGNVSFNFYDTYFFVAEYVCAAKSFARNDLSFNNHGAKPQAFYFETSVDFWTKNIAHTIFTGMDLSSEALALDLPKRSYFVGYNIQFIKHTYLELEYRHYVNYNNGDTAGSVLGTVLNSAGNGGHDNIVILAAGIYF